jgi:hypothetical protein
MPLAAVPDEFMRTPPKNDDAALRGDWSSAAVLIVVS